MNDLLWFTTEGPAPSRLPKYKRTFGFADGKLAFLPAWVCRTTDIDVFMCAAFDGARIARDSGHTYFHVDWVLKEFPASKPQIQELQRMLDDYLANNNPLT